MTLFTYTSNMLTKNAVRSATRTIFQENLKKLVFIRPQLLIKNQLV